MQPNDPVESPFEEQRFHNLLDEYVSKAGWNSILGRHMRGLQEGVVKARSDVQALLCEELPRLRMALDPTLPAGSKAALGVILGDLEQAAWALAESLDGKESDALFADGKMNPGPWVELIQTMDQLERRASFYLVAIDEQRRKGSDPVPDFAGSLEHDDLRPAKWFDEATDEYLYPTLLRQAARSNRLSKSKKIHGRWHHSVGEVCVVYSERREAILKAIQSESNEIKAKQ